MRCLLLLFVAWLAFAVAKDETHTEVPELEPPAAPVAFHEAGKEEVQDQAAVQLASQQDVVDSLNNDTASASSLGEGSGLAWDKHDFEVTNNHGGDVQVEVNLAAPMTSSGNDASGSNELEDIAPLLEALANNQRDDGPDPVEMMKMMMKAIPQPQPQPQIDIPALIRQLKTVVQPPQPDDSDQIQQLMNGVMDAIKELGRRQQVAPPPPQQMYDVPAIIEALQPPQQPPQPPIDVAALMREMRKAIEAGQQPPPPPPGLDPGLLDLLKQMMNDMKDMMANANKDHGSTMPPPPPPYDPNAGGNVNIGDGGSVGGVEGPPQGASIQPPPIIPSSDDLQKQLADALAALQAAMPGMTLPPFPNSGSDADLEALKALLANQLNASSKPIILPPPLVDPAFAAHTSLLPPPPPPPPTSGLSQQDILALLRSQMGKPQRIPAPPVIHQQGSDGPCCMAPPPDGTTGSESEEKCPKINGLALPRCKRPPPTGVVKCRRKKCGQTDADGDFDVDQPGDEPFCEGECEDGKLNTDAFNPKALLEKLCPNGNCGPRPAPVHTHSQASS